MGAGSSIPVGKPSVECINKLMLGWSSEWKPPIGSRLTNPYKEIWNASEDYFNSVGEDDSYNSQVYTNFENVLGEMVSLADRISPPTRGNPIIEKIADKQENNCFGKLLNLPNDERVKERNSIMEQYEFLITKLATDMRNSCTNDDLDSCCNFKLYKKFFEILKSKFDLGIYTLNYDNVAIKALPDAFTGFDGSDIFDPNNIFNRKEWGFIYHLHGSVHLTLPGNKKEIKWKSNLDGEFEVYDGMHLQRVNDTARLPRTTLLAGGFKLGQLLPEPYQTFHASLVRHAYEADVLLIIGYGMGDSHVNWAIKNRHRSPQRFKKILIIDKNDELKAASINNLLSSKNYWLDCLTYLFTGFTNNKGDDYNIGGLRVFDPWGTQKNKAVFLEGTDKAFNLPNDIADWLENK